MVQKFFNNLYNTLGITVLTVVETQLKCINEEIQSLHKAENCLFHDLTYCVCFFFPVFGKEQQFQMRAHSGKLTSWSTWTFS